MKKIGILTWYNHGNYGSAMQAYALKTYLKKMGYRAEIIPYIPLWERNLYNQKFIKRLKKILKRVYGLFLNVLSSKNYKYIDFTYVFRKKYLEISNQCTEEDIAQYVKKYSTIICGSDQIWNPTHIDYTFLLDFSPEHINKISYAVSLGVQEFPNEHKNNYISLLQHFDAISVREDSGLMLLNDFGIKSSVHVDPALLLNVEEYRKISHSLENVNQKFIFCYFLKTNNEYKTAIVEYAKSKGLDIVGISFNNDDYHWMKNVSFSGPREWLWLIDNAEIVMTNSYHATIFSIIFHTPFYSFLRFLNKDHNSQNSRIEQLNKYFDIEKNIIDTDIMLPDTYCTNSFEKYDESILDLQKKAYEYLIENIK